LSWNLRRGINIGPLRINLSKKGLSYSLGVHGFRAGTDASGRRYTQTSIPGTGIYRRDYFKNASNRGKWALAIVAVVLAIVFLLFVR
jgi:hypothetical protein